MSRVLAFLCAAILVLLPLGCGHPSQMTAMSITPTGVTINAPSIGFAGATTQLKAYGTFIHPAETRDITTQVSWSSSTPAIATVDNTGKVTTAGQGCGVTIITATADSHLVGTGGSESIMTATASVDVKFPGLNCP